MKPRPFYRWKSFWLGLFVLVFLSWAWRDSFYKVAAVQIRGGGVSSADGGLMFDYSPARSVVWRASYQSSPFLHPKWGIFQPPAFERGQGKITLNRDEFYPALQAAADIRAYYRLIMINQRNGHWIACLPYWLLMLLFLIPWSAFLAWRWRRQRILTKTHSLSCKSP